MYGFPELSNAMFRLLASATYTGFDTGGGEPPPPPEPPPPGEDEHEAEKKREKINAR
jgi:hypothetical protein